MVCNGAMWRPRPSYARRAFRRSARDFVAGNWLLLVGFAAIIIAGIVPLSLALDGYPLGLLHGASGVFILASIGLIFLMHTGSIWQLAGAYGEDNTREELRKAMRRGAVWGWVDNLEVADGDVDHLVVTPAGVIAVDSKWHARELTSELVRADVESAAAAARRARLVLRSIGHLVDVKPLVVVWGRGQRDVPEGRAVGAVVFVRGRLLQKWLDNCEGTITREDGREVIKALQEFKKRVDPDRSRRVEKCRAATMAHDRSRNRLLDRWKRGNT